MKLALLDIWLNRGLIPFDDLEKRPELGDLLLVPLVGLTQSAQFFPLLPKKIPSALGLFQ